jgi:hypothetical protein
MQKGHQNGGITVSTIFIFLKSLLRGNDDSRWTVCKKTTFTLPKTDPRPTNMYAKSMLENDMHKLSTTPEQVIP